MGINEYINMASFIALMKWSVEFLFFTYLIQMSSIVTLKALFASTNVGEMSDEYFSNITVFSILWASFIMFYVM